MKTEFVAKKSITLNTDISKVWEALTNPEWIRQYFFGTEAVSDWKVGSSLIFKGTWEGKEYVDKGHILKLEPEKLLQYNYWSSFSGTADIEENYSNITYQLSKENDQVLLTITQDNCTTAEAAAHSGENWMVVLNNLKNLLEKK